jgi:hypothetical protein
VRRRRDAPPCREFTGVTNPLHQAPPPETLAPCSPLRPANRRSRSAPAARRASMGHPLSQGRARLPS